MPSVKEIEDFVKKGLDNGRPKETIKSDLISVGWREIDIEDTITSIENSTQSSRQEDLAQTEANTPVNQLRFAHLKETISQYQPQKKISLISEKISPKSRGILSLILIPIVIALGVGARMYLKKNHPEIFEFKNNSLDIDQKILDQLDPNSDNNSSSSTNPPPSQNPTPPTQPPSAGVSVKITYPKGGETWEIGKTYTIQYSATGDNFWPIEIAIKQFSLLNDSPYGETLILTDGENTGNFRFKVPEKILGSGGIERMNFKSPPQGPARYKVEVRAWTTEKILSASDFFKIEAPAESAPPGQGNS